MKKEYVILLLAGIIIAAFVIKAKKNAEIIKPGDKGNEVSALQETLTSITGIKFNNVGAYDNDTLKVVQYYMKNTTALKDFEKGFVDKSFASDLLIIENNMKNV